MGSDTIRHQALTLEYEGRFQEARELFEQCLNDPTFDEGDLLFHCAWCMEQEKCTSDALTLYARAAETTHIPSCKINCYFRIGWILMHNRDHLQAAEMFRSAIDYGDLVGLHDQTYCQALYWYAVCLEAQARYLEAMPWYKLVQHASPMLEPEARLRQLMCLVHVGMYEEALELCRWFDAPPPADFDPERYHALRIEVGKERRILEACLAPLSPQPHTDVYATC